MILLRLCIIEILFIFSLQTSALGINPDVLELGYDNDDYHTLIQVEDYLPPVSLEDFSKRNRLSDEDTILVRYWTTKDYSEYRKIFTDSNVEFPSHIDESFFEDWRKAISPKKVIITAKFLLEDNKGTVAIYQYQIIYPEIIQYNIWGLRKIGRKWGLFSKEDRNNYFRKELFLANINPQYLKNLLAKTEQRDFIHVNRFMDISSKETEGNKKRINCKKLENIKEEIPKNLLNQLFVKDYDAYNLMRQQYNEIKKLKDAERK